MIPVGEWMLFRSPLDGLAVYFAAAALIMGLVGTGFAIPSWLTKRHMRKKGKQGELGRWYWWTGAAVNGVVGLAYALVAVWCAMFLRDMYLETPKIVDTTSVLERASGAVAKTAMRGFLSEKMTSTPALEPISERFAEDPGTTLKGLQTALENPAFKQMVADPEFQQAALHHDRETMVDLDSYRHLLQDPEFNAVAESLGLRSDTGPHPFVDLTASTYRKLQTLKDDPEVAQLLEDREFIRQVREQDTWSILNDPRVLTLAQKLGQLSDPGPPAPIAEVTRSKPAPKKMYKWRDRDGNLNITNSPPPEGAEIIE